jgi:Cu-Zn family superoxide dismutase
MRHVAAPFLVVLVLTACTTQREEPPRATGDTATSSAPDRARAPRGTEAAVTFRTADGRDAGTAALTETGAGVLVRATLRNLPPGTHALHVHETGTCEPPFESAGGHYNPTDRQHGFLNPQGEHAGDLTNITVGADGTASADLLAPEVTLGTAGATLRDTDGSSLVVHAGADDYRTDPSGNSGDRIACGVIGG